MLTWLTGRRAALLIACAALGLLAGAHGFERLGGLAPCPLCLVQREALWVVAVIALAAATVPRAASRTLLFAGAGVLFAGALLAASHAGAERKWWPGPEHCASDVNVAPPAQDLLGALAAPAAAPACDEAPLRIIGLSLADVNALINAGLAAFALAAAAYRPERISP